MRVGILSVCMLIILLPAAYSICSKQQTERYLSEGTEYRFEEKKVDYIIVIDRSGSMEGPKLQKVKEAAKALIAQLPQADRAAIISFNNEGTLHQPLTNDRAALTLSLDEIKAEFSTRYTPALLLAEKEFSTSSHEKALIFLSDGRSDFTEPPEEILAVTESLANQGVCIMTIGYALHGEESPTLQAMAAAGKQTGCGEHFVASEQGTELQAVFNEIYTKVSSTDVITITPSFTDDNYSFTFSSKLNNYSLPGKKGTACSDEPEFTVRVYRGSQLVNTQYEPKGTLRLPNGKYTYEASAALTCDGSCNLRSAKTGTFTVQDGGGCYATYTDVATYVTGETQVVDIVSSGFSPRSVTGRQGTVIVWRNKEEVPRRITSAYFNKTIEPGASFSYIIENVGTLVYSDPDRNITGSVQPLEGIGTDVLLVIDESGSMKGSGITEAREAAANFFAILTPADRGALITFSHQAHLTQDFTSDKTALAASARSLRAEGATNYLSALRLASTLRPAQQGVLIFMSDGVPTDAEGEPAILAVTKQLRDKGWCIMTVGFGEEGKAARQLLATMASGDECSAFLYASSGRLSESFGTIYQLAHEQQDLQFTKRPVPLISFSRSLAVDTGIVTKLGKPVPAIESVCVPEAVVQASAGAATTLLVYEGGSYSGTLAVPSGIHTVRVVASLTAVDEPTRAFVQTGSYKTLVIPPFAIVAVVVLLGVILIYVRALRRK